MTQVLFSNSPSLRDFGINFFHQYSFGGLGGAQLACPFFHEVEPLRILRQNGCGRIRLLVRLCSITNPQALRSALDLGDIQIRYFTKDSFHAKFYILGRAALIGSANLTGAGLTSNRELSVVIADDHENFDDIPACFDELWNRAAVLTDDALKRFTNWYQTGRPPHQSDKIDGLIDVGPETVNVGTRQVSHERTYLQSYHHQYYEVLIPSYKKVQGAYESLSKRHPNFKALDIGYEIDRFLSWTKLKFTTDDRLLENPIRSGTDLIDNILIHAEKWMGTPQETDNFRISRLSKLKSIFSDKETLEQVDFTELKDALLGCAAFDEQLRFTKGGREELVRLFEKDNSLDRVRATFMYLAHGNDEFVKRTYDCVYSAVFKLRHFGKSSVMELYGWTNPDGIPPLNMRAVKALRYLGFDILV